MKKKVYKFDWIDSLDRFEAAEGFEVEAEASEKLMIAKL